jgi:hypothetical protein
MEPTAASALEPAPAPGAPPPPNFADLPAAAVARIAEMLVPDDPLPRWEPRMDSLPGAPPLHHRELAVCRDAVALMSACSAWRSFAAAPLRARLAIFARLSHASLEAETSWRRLGAIAAGWPLPVCDAEARHPCFPASAWLPAEFASMGVGSAGLQPAAVAAAAALTSR